MSHIDFEIRVVFSDNFQNSSGRTKHKICERALKAGATNLNVLNSQCSDLHGGLESISCVSLKFMNCLEVHGHVPGHFDQNMS